MFSRQQVEWSRKISDKSKFSILSQYSAPPPKKIASFCLTLMPVSLRTQFHLLQFPNPWLSRPLWNHSRWDLAYPLDLPCCPDLGVLASPTSCSLRSCPISTLGSLPWTVPEWVKALHYSGGHYNYHKWGMCSTGHFPEFRSEASKPFARQQACNGHLLWGEREDEGLAWERAQAPLHVGHLSYHHGACFDTQCWAHLWFSQVWGNLSTSVDLPWAILTWLEPSARHCSPPALSENLKSGQHHSLTNIQYISSGPRRPWYWNVFLPIVIFSLVEKVLFWKLLPCRGNESVWENAHHGQRPEGWGWEKMGDSR